MDYQPVGGIMMPSRMSSPDAGAFDLEIRLDVEYDSEIFERRPALEDGPDGWMPAGR